MSIAFRRKVWAGLFAATLCLSATAAQAQPVRVQAAYDKRNPIYVNVPFVFQVQVEGSNTPQTPVFPSTPDFEVEAAGQQENSSSSTTIINGKVSQTNRLGYLFNYQLTPRRTGTLVVPAVSVEVDGKVRRTQPVRVEVSKAEESKDVKLRAELSKKRCYVGEPLLLTVTWYFNMNVRGFDFHIPIIEDDRFSTDDVPIRQARGKKYFSVPLPGGEAIAEQGTGRLGGADYATLTFRKAIIPREAGVFALSPASVSCKGVVGRSRRSPFDSFFNDDFFGRSQTRTFAASSDALTLEVIPLPDEGRPVRYSGLVGSFRIKAEAAPREVNVGDPITLTLSVSGSPYLRHVGLPPLAKQADLAESFRIPTEIASGRIEDRKRIFTQTIRPNHADVTEIPPIELPFFEPQEGKYHVAKTKAIPIKVRETKVLTADDVEGRAPGAIRSKVTVWREGIAHNYEDQAVLAVRVYTPDRWLRSPGSLALVLLPPLAYLVILVATVGWRKRHADPAARRARQAGVNFTVAAAALRGEMDAEHVHAALLDALRTYLGDRLRLTAGALTGADADRHLAGQGIEAALRASIVEVFGCCEASRYAGGGGEETGALLDRATELVQAVEKELGR